MNISYSGINTYQTCPLKYKYQNIDKIKEPKSKEAVFGTIIHNTLKYYHDPSLLSPTLEQALDYFSKNWNSDVFEQEVEERAAFAQGIEIIQKYCQKNDPAKFNIVALESRFQIKMGDEKKPHIISGIIDRIDKTDDGYEIIDYKTTKKMPSQEKVDNDLQLSIYTQAFLSRYPKEKKNLNKVKVSLYYLKHGVKLSSTRTLPQLDESQQIFLNVIKEIEEKRFDAIVGPLCDWCGYQKYCPMWKHKFKEERKIDTKEINDAIEEFIKLKQDATSIRHRVAELQEMIATYMQQEGVERVFSDRGEITKSLRKTYGYDMGKLKMILDPLDKWEEAIKVDGTSLRKIMKQLDKQTQRMIEEVKQVDRESVSYNVKKK